MNPFRRSLTALLLSVAVAGAQAQRPADASARLAVLSPFLEDQTLAVARVNLQKLDVEAALKLVAELAPDNLPADGEAIKTVEQQGKQILASLSQAGVNELYFVASLADFPKEPLLVVAPLKAGADPQAASKTLSAILRFPRSEAIGGSVVLGSDAVIGRVKTIRPAARPEFGQGLARAGDSAAQFVLAPSDDVRRVLREMLPRLPDEIGGGSGKMLSDVSWIALSVEAPPKLSLALTIQARDADSASSLRGLAVSGLQLVSRQDEIRREIPKIDDLIRLLTPQVKGDRLTVELTSENGGANQAIALLARPLQAARTAAGRAQSVNNLKQIMIAMHNYHDTYGAFPPQAIRSKDGKPLLSWRVALLPFIDDSPLYKEFHLDEPWDSEHNKQLIEKMPMTLASPHLGDALRAKGMTSYVVPLSKQPPAVFVAPKPIAPEAKGGRTEGEKAKGPLMVFDVSRGTQMRLISDGTSNTIGVVEAHPKHAVIWTKPDDLVIEAKDPAAALRGQPSDGFNAGLCDGSVRFLKATLDAKTLMRLFQMDDGEPIGEF